VLLRGLQELLPCLLLLLLLLLLRLVQHVMQLGAPRTMLSQLARKLRAKLRRSTASRIALLLLLRLLVQCWLGPRTAPLLLAMAAGRLTAAQREHLCAQQ
jgi:hypothetical protein